ncbi:MAG: site-specific integrase [Muribaculaceae bacterium]|nr:site-specific integrase [Muribaculaceae bacterium]
MITTKFYLDKRATKPGYPAPIKLSITKNGVAAYISMNIAILINQWDKKAQSIVNHPQKRQLNAFLAQRKVEIDQLIFRLLGSGELDGLRAPEIKDRVYLELNPPTEDNSHKYFATRFMAFANSKSESTRKVYITTYNSISAYEPEFGKLRFEDINKDWLVNYELYLVNKGIKKNTRNIHFRNIRAVFNDAIDNEITSAYPFRKFKIKPEPTRKRSFDIQTLRTIFNMEVEPDLQKYVDLFKLTFFLIGINVVDLCRLTNISDGRIIYNRAKTGKRYSIKVEPEAMEIIEKYRGEHYLLYMLERHSTYRTFYMQWCRAFSKIKERLKLPELSTYWARHSWATIAAALDIPKETIAEALGHEMGNSTTAIYIDFDKKKVDEANRKVIDWVLGKADVAAQKEP